MTDASDLIHEYLPGRPDIAMFTAPNPGPKTLSGTHSYVVGCEKAYVIDPGPDLPAYQEALARWIRDRADVQGILLTHGHPDHAPGASTLRTLLGVPVWASEAMTPAERAAFGVDRTFVAHQPFLTDQDRLHVVGTPGHRSDHVAFWLSGSRILFAGDAILGQGTSVIAPPEGDMTLYLQSLHDIRQLEPAIIAPGHGPLVTDPHAKIEEYITHRREREDQILRAMASGPASLDELTARVYADVDHSLLDLARASLEAQLIKLEREGRIVRDGSHYHLVYD
jgi:glyoxylase-like metal-dependent hydrolase (beta-lactamase superfamily II)